MVLVPFDSYFYIFLKGIGFMTFQFKSGLSILAVSRPENAFHACGLRVVVKLFVHIVKGKYFVLSRENSSYCVRKFLRIF